MDRKGLELPFGGIMLGFLVIGSAVIIYLVLYARILDVHVIVAEYEAEIHAINLAQVLLSSDLAYHDGYTLHRGVFDKFKLDNELDKLDIWYPDAIAVIGIKDLETDEEWSTVLTPKTVGGTAANDLIDCLINTIKIDITMIFRVPSGNPWEWPDITKCFTESIGDQYVPAVREFPIAIRVSDNEIHAGRMRVSLREIIFSEVVG